MGPRDSEHSVTVLTIPVWLCFCKKGNKALCISTKPQQGKIFTQISQVIWELSRVGVGTAGCDLGVRREAGLARFYLYI